MKLILIRHGMTEANERHLYCGSSDISLSSSGKENLKMIKESGIYPGISGMRVVTSGMKRSNETLLELYGNISYETDPGFREIDFGVFEMKSYEELKDNPLYIRWIEGDNEKNIIPGGESGEIFKNRVFKSLDYVIHNETDTVIITHGGVISVIMNHLFAQENKNRYQWQPSFGRGYIVFFDSTTYSLL